MFLELTDIDRIFHLDDTDGAEHAHVSDVVEIAGRGDGLFDYRLYVGDASCHIVFGEDSQ